MATFPVSCHPDLSCIKWGCFSFYAFLNRPNNTSILFLLVTPHTPVVGWRKDSPTGKTLFSVGFCFGNGRYLQIEYQTIAEKPGLSNVGNT